MSKIKVSEKNVKEAIKQYLKAKGIYFYCHSAMGAYDKQGGYYMSSIPGVADIIGIMADGKFLAIEVKSSNGKTSPQQDLFLMHIRQNNGIAIVANSIDDVIEVLG